MAERVEQERRVVTTGVRQVCASVTSADESAARIPVAEAVAGGAFSPLCFVSAEVGRFELTTVCKRSPFAICEKCKNWNGVL
ncbi:hypothetical protein GPA22_17700 [Aromatoleum toluvorans]|uniref:Uncharacterized protein n=1 Tax=Aromatoleum toluvorans TaxID=92002 RepID=A0ABX1Q426_9RHOO|nr:hypothetical protein [Aromatoleum toluvorans]NMG45552.1 hypothetical protein [Aromatoleum toluvorans]